MITIFRMKGVVPPMITPFKENGDVDFDGLGTLLNFLKEKVDGLFITGSYGSGALLTTEERKKVTEFVMKTVDGEIPVIAMVGSTSNRLSVELARHAVSCGVQAVSSVGPYYYRHNEDSLAYYYEDILKAAADTPVYVYNNPKFQGYEMSLTFLKKMKKLGISGIKDATFDILVHATYHRVLKDDSFDVVLGTEAMWLPARVLGAEAFIPGLANAFPEICRKMYREGMENDFAACRETQFRVNQVREIMYLAKSTQLAVYAMLELRGLLTAYPRGPFVQASKKEKESIKKELESLDIL